MTEDTGKREIKRRGSRSNQKLKILFLMKIFMENTDRTHDITLQEIIEKLDVNNVTAERKSLYDDIEQLRLFGMDIRKEQYGKTFHYRLVSRDFELAELKLLVDSVQSAKFITEKKFNELIKKIERLASRHEASQLHRQVYVAGRVKSMNNDIIRNVDAIQQAIGTDVQISFQYFQWNVKKRAELRKNGKRYHISPWGLTRDDENYYMIGYDVEDGIIKHYRVDKMLNVHVEVMPRDGKQEFRKLDMAAYAKKMFAMFDGEEQMVEILCKNYLAGVMIDRFGRDVRMLKVDEEQFRVFVNVAVSRHFLGWVMALGEGAKIIGPQSVVDKVGQEIDRLILQYRGENNRNS